MAGTNPATKRRKPASVRATPRAVIEASSLQDDFEPVRLKSNKEKHDAERVIIAYLDDYELTMPAIIKPNIALKIMRAQRKEGEAPAMMLMLEEVLGDEGFTKLIEFDDLDSDDLIDLFGVVQRVAMGALETPKSSS